MKSTLIEKPFIFNCSKKRASPRHELSAKRKRTFRNTVRKESGNNFIRTVAAAKTFPAVKKRRASHRRVKALGAVGKAGSIAGGASDVIGGVVGKNFVFMISVY